MGASEYAGLTAVVTGGASGIGLATARLLAARGARVACPDLKPHDVPAPLAGIPADMADVADMADDVTIRAAVEGAARRLGGIDTLVDNAGIGAQGSREVNTSNEWCRVFEVNVFGVVRVSRGRPAASAPLPECSDRQHLLHRRDRRAAPPGPVLIDEGRGSLPHPRDRLDLVHSRDPSELCQPRHGRQAVDRPSAGPCRRPRDRPCQHRSPASRWADLSPPTTSPSCTPRVHSPVPPQVLILPSTASCTDCGCGPAPDLPHETVPKENQQ